MLTARVADDRRALWFASKRLIRGVRRSLARYGLRPVEPAWSMAWAWAKVIAESYIYRPSWPLAHEIATQYLLILLSFMKEERDLKLPYRAARMPPQVATLFARSPLALPAPPKEV